MSLQTIDLARLRPQAGQRLLDLGCGQGRHAISACMARNLEAVGVDLSFEDLQTTRERFRQFAGAGNKRLTVSVADAGRLPFADETFDRLVCAEVLEHLPDHYPVIREMGRVLKAGGIAAVSVPRYFPEWVCWRLSDAYHAEAGGHVRIFRAGALKRDVESAGFVFYHRHHAHALHVPYWWLKCLFWREKGQADAPVVEWYHRFLTWDLMTEPALTRWPEKLLNPVMGKSLVMYFVKMAPAV